jgi:3-oxoadipate enol-lactonase
MAASVEESFASSYPPEVRHDAEHYREFRARWIANDPVSYGNIYRMLIHAELGEVLGRIVCPVLAVAGTLDRLRPPAVVEPIAAGIPGARFVAVESGHFMAVQTPGVVADVMNGFLRPLGC